MSFFVATGKRPKGKVIEEKVVDIRELRKETNMAFVLGCSELFAKHKSVDPSKIALYIPWKGKPVAITDFNVIRDGEDLFVCCGDHVKALQYHIMSSGESRDEYKEDRQAQEPGRKRKREKLGENTKERLRTHVEHIDDKTYNNSERRWRITLTHSNVKLF